MRHPDWDYYTYNFIKEIMCQIADKSMKVINLLDKVINFFDHTYATAAEGMGMFSFGDTTPNWNLPYGHLEIYDRGCHNMPRYQEVPFVRVVTNNAKWNHWESRYNDCSIPVSISDNPKPLKKYRFKNGDISKVRFRQYLRFIGYNKDLLLKIWYEGRDFKDEFKDPEKMFCYNNSCKKKKGGKDNPAGINRETACGDLKLGPANSAFPLEIWFDRSSMDDEIYPHPDIKISVLKEGAGCDKKYLSYHFLSKYVDNWWDFYEMEAKDKKNRGSKKDILRVLHFIDSNADMLCLYYGIDVFTGKRMDYKINEEKFRKAVVVRATGFFDR